MNSYDETIAAIGQQLATFTPTQALVFAQVLIRHFVRELPSDWLAGELPQEQPYYQTLVLAVEQPIWDDAVIEDTLDALDDIMWQLGEHYPHSTDIYPLQLMGMLDYYLHLLQAQQAERDMTKDNATMTIATTTMSLANDEAVFTNAVMLADEYLGFYDDLLAAHTGEPNDLQNWTASPAIRQALEHIENALACARQSHPIQP